MAFNIPNILTLARLAAVPFIGVFLSREQYLASLVTLSVAALLDFLDGAVARRFNLVTPIGRILDPLADKLFIVSTLAFLTFTGRQFIPHVLFFTVVGKELLIATGGLVLLRRGVEVSARWYGKMATAVIYCTLLAFLLAATLLPVLAPLTPVLMIASIVAALIAVGMYVFCYFLPSLRDPKTVDQEH